MLLVLVAAVAAGLWWGFRKSAQMGRRILAGVALTLLLAVVLVAALNRPHPRGEVPIESVSPPGSDLRISSSRFCHDDFPGYSASGDVPLSFDEAIEWYSDRFGPNDSAVVARKVFEDREVLEFDQLKVWLTGGGDHTWVSVKTYQTVGHECPMTTMRSGPPNESMRGAAQAYAAAS